MESGELDKAGFVFQKVHLSLQVLGVSFVPEEVSAEKGDKPVKNSEDAESVMKHLLKKGQKLPVLDQI